MTNYVTCPDNFHFRANFLDLTDSQVLAPLQTITAALSRVYTLWSILSPAERDAKRELCVNYLVGWKLANMYPERTVGVGSTGTMPLTMKIVDRVHIHYRDTIRQGTGVLDMLTNNVFGMHALTMIQGAPENYMVML